MAGHDNGASAGVPVTWVNCPACRQPSRYAADNAYRPFCSRRCKEHDLGAWASEAFRVPDDTPPGEDQAAGH